MVAKGGIHMEYTIRQLAALAGVSTRTLRWYDRLGLLRPHRVGENGYRYYTSAEADRLQHILFYRALGVELAQIQMLLDDPSFNRMAALKGHLTALERERARIDALIHTVRRTIQAEERNEPLMDNAKFEAFKRDAVVANEAQYGSEIRARYGDEAVDASNEKLLGMSSAQHAEWKALEQEILERLEAAVRAGIAPDSPEGRAIADLHLRWLSHVLPDCTRELQINLIQMYLADDRFRAYYDRDLPNCADFLARAAGAGGAAACE